MCEQCGENKKTKDYLVHNGLETVISVCAGCAEWNREHESPFEYKITRVYRKHRKNTGRMNEVDKCLK